MTTVEEGRMKNWFLYIMGLITLFSAEGNKADIRYQDLKLFSDVLHTIEKTYIKPVPERQLIRGAVQGLMNQLDAHSYFLSEEQMAHFKKSAQGTFSGLGLEIQLKGQRPVVMGVFEGSPAYKAGLKAGQRILEINQENTKGLNQKEILTLLKGRRGTLFRIKVADPDSKKSKQITLRSTFVTVPSVLKKQLEEGFLYVRIQSFTQRTDKEVQKILDKKGAMVHPLGVILDLRGNAGGLFDSAIRVADLFIKEGIIVSIKGRKKNHNQVIKAKGLGTLPDFPLLVLIDAYSASSAEVLAGALKDHKRAMLLGRKSFGKASVQSLIPLDQGGALQLTVAHYYRPSGQSIHNLGIVPDMTLKAPTTDWTFAGTGDTDLKQALSLLKSSYLKFSSTPEEN